MKKYLLIKSNEDGEPITELSEVEVNDLDKVMEDNSITKWVFDNDLTETGYWKDGEAMLIEATILKPKPLSIKTKYSI